MEENQVSDAKDDGDWQNFEEDIEANPSNEMKELSFVERCKTLFCNKSKFCLRL
jgi:hypothetical protein